MEHLLQVSLPRSIKYHYHGVSISLSQPTEYQHHYLGPPNISITIRAHSVSLVRLKPVSGSIVSVPISTQFHHHSPFSISITMKSHSVSASLPRPIKYHLHNPNQYRGLFTAPINIQLLGPIQYQHQFQGPFTISITTNAYSVSFTQPKPVSGTIHCTN